VVAVHGNVDDAHVRAALPATASIAAAGATIAMIHDAGPAKGRLARLRRRFPDADAVVFGHSHIPLHEHAPDGFQIFNPGSPTERRRAPRHTMGIARAESGSLTFELIALG
jgi:predicted phosphodiesterase